VLAAGACRRSSTLEGMSSRLVLRLLLCGLLSSTDGSVPVRAVPRIIQGGMGARISSWKLARAVSSRGELGITSGVAMDVILARELQIGDPEGIWRRALAAFPDQDMAQRILDKFYIPEGKSADKPFKSLPMWTIDAPQSLLEMTVVANFCEIWLAKHNDDSTPTNHGHVGINCLTKIQLPNVPSLYGAMLAECDYVIMGAGIPMEIPGILDDLAAQKDIRYSIHTDGAEADDERVQQNFSPKAFWEAAGKPEMAVAPIKRPNFVPIVSSVLLAQSMLKRARGAGPTKGIQGFVIEMPTAGGHNAPPRGFRYDPVAKSHSLALNERGEPMYGEKDAVDLNKFKKAVKGLPFWLAGSYARADKFCDVVDVGGHGVQVGTLFALSDESGMADHTRQRVLGDLAAKGKLSVYTDPVASPTGFPFKVLELEGTLSDKANYDQRPRVCNLGYLRTPYMKEDGEVGYRCAAEPVKDWVRKGGEVEATIGRKCLCNGLMADAGVPQLSPFKKEGESERYLEEVLVTMGDDVNAAASFMKQDENGRWGYSATAVVDYLVSQWESAGGEESYDGRGDGVIVPTASSATDGPAPAPVLEREEEAAAI